MQETISDSSGCRSLFTRQRMQETLNQKGGAKDSISESEHKSLFIRQRMQDTISDSGEGASISDSGCKRLYQTADASDSI